MSDKTILDARPSAEQRTIKFKNLTATQKSRLSAAMIGVGGISLGALTMALMGKASNADANDGDIHKADINNVINRKTGEEEMEVPVFEASPFATSTSDDMSFGEVFGVARAEVGPGGFFEYRGETYNTYYKEEWDALPPEEQKEFYASVDDSGIDKTDDRIEDDSIVIIKDEAETGEDIVIVNEDQIIAILNDDEEGDADIFIGGEEDIVITNDDDYEEIVVIEDDNGDFVVIDEDGGGEFVVIEDDNPFEEDNYDDDIAVIEDDIDISDLG